jgi:hypothetical protein
MAALHMMKGTKTGLQIMRYELTDYEWAYQVMLPNKAQACLVWTIDVSSTASAGCCDPAHHHGAICRLLWSTHHLLQPFRPVAKGGVWGGSWTHLPPLMMRPSKSTRPSCACISTPPAC